MRLREELPGLRAGPHQACLRGFRVGYYASSRLFGELRLAKADGSYVQELEKISKQALLIID